MSEFNKGAQHARDDILATIIGLQNEIGGDEHLDIGGCFFEKSADSEAHFVEGIRSGDDYLEILNWYRNLYHAENPDTERGIMVRAINDLFMAMKQGAAEELFQLKKRSVRING